MSTELQRLLEWLKDDKRKPAAAAFTAGPLREAADYVEMGSAVAILALVDRVRELEGAVAEARAAIDNTDPAKAWTSLDRATEYIKSRLLKAQGAVEIDQGRIWTSRDIEHVVYWCLKPLWESRDEAVAALAAVTPKTDEQEKS